MKFKEQFITERKLFSGRVEDISPQEGRLIPPSQSPVNGSRVIPMSDIDAKEVGLWDLANIMGSLAVYVDGADPMRNNEEAIEALFLEVITKNFKKIPMKDAIWDRKDTFNPPAKLALDSLDYEIKGNTISGSFKVGNKTYKGKAKFKKKSHNTSGMYYEN